MHKSSPSLPSRFSIYLMSCYLYYEEDVHVLSDTQFDNLCKELLDHWDEFEHPHKHLITTEDLKAGTGYAIKYPLMVIGAARQWYRSQMGVSTKPFLGKQ